MDEEKKVCGFNMAGEDEEPDLCEEPLYRRTGRCIFHANASGKKKAEDKDNFLQRLRKRIDESEEIIDCRGFVFPPDEGFFYSKTINKDIDFSRAVFAFDIEFRDTEFRGNAKFRETKFKKGMYCYGVKCSHSMDFNSAAFEGYVSFFNVLNVKRTSFFFARFNDDVRFNFVKFGVEGTFENAFFDGDIEFYDAGAQEVDFSHVSTNVNTLAIFNEMDLGGWSFVETVVIKNAQFIDVSWGGDGRLKRDHTRDEALAKSGLASYGSAATVYRRLRKNYEEKLAYSEAGDFHIGEMEMRRLGLRQNGWKRFFNLSWLFLHFYRVFGGYGERIRNPIISFIAVGLAFAGLWSLIGFPVPEGDTFKISNNFGLAVLFSFKTFLTLPGKALCLVQECVGAVQRAAGVGIITLFILALRRAFRR